MTVEIRRKGGSHGRVVFDHDPVKRIAYRRLKEASSPFAVRFTGKYTRGVVGFYAIDLDNRG